MSIPKPNLTQKVEKALSDSLYKNAIETSSNYNNRLIAERLGRLPFIDPQTGVAQNNCSLWMNRWERMPGYNQGQIYSYPSHRWHRSRRSYLFTDVSSDILNLEVNEGTGSSVRNDSDISQIEYHVKSENVNYNDKFDSFKETLGSVEPEEATADLNYLVEAEEADTEEDEDSINGNRKKRKKYGKRKKANEYTDAEKPYLCDFCGIKYKTRPGLAYHYSPSHPNASVDMIEGARNPISIGMDEIGEISSRSVIIIPNHSHPGLSIQSSSGYQGHLNNSRESRDKTISPTSNLTDQRSLTFNCPSNQQSSFGLPSKYSTIGKSSISQDSDESTRNILWPLYDPLFSSA